jgi:hypothetical protein
VGIWFTEVWSCMRVNLMIFGYGFCSLVWLLAYLAGRTDQLWFMTSLRRLLMLDTVVGYRLLISNAKSLSTASLDLRRMLFVLIRFKTLSYRMDVIYEQLHTSLSMSNKKYTHKVQNSYTNWHSFLSTRNCKIDEDEDSSEKIKKVKKVKKCFNQQLRCATVNQRSK